MLRSRGVKSVPGSRTHTALVFDCSRRVWNREKWFFLPFLPPSPPPLKSFTVETHIRLVERTHLGAQQRQQRRATTLPTKTRTGSVDQAQATQSHLKQDSFTWKCTAVQSFQLVPLAVVVVHFYLFGVSLPILVKDAATACLLQFL